MANITDLIGQTYGFLTVVSIVRRSALLCKCKCGNDFIIAECDWHVQKRRSCGCWRKAIGHNMTNSPTWRSWRSFRDRCNKKDHHNYPRYGGRGITYDPRWDDFSVFVKEMGVRPKGKTLDRKNVDGPYCKNNCKWSSPKEQSNNKRDNVFIEYKGRKQTVMQWAEELGMNWATLRSRVERGWSPGACLTKPVAHQFNSSK